ncbi:hypothetical protein [Sorangium sp. So ce861]|uniref:hypothetical protein n=1 Tax=Sorangium sp. So ce861 TaxID=3133323 RepID=UPI003F63C719
MTQAIPTGTSQTIRGYIATAQTFDHAASELLETISHHRKGNDFKVKGGLSRVDVRPKGAPLIRLRLHGGTVVDVPSWTKALRVKGTQDPSRDGPQHMNAETINTLELLGDPIDRFVGGAVLYRQALMRISSSMRSLNVRCQRQTISCA